MKYDDVVEAMPAWLDSMYGNSPLDKSRCEDFIAAVYATANLEKPLVVWCKSFFQLTAIILGWTADKNFSPIYQCAENADLNTKNIWRQLVIDIEDQDLSNKLAQITPDRLDGNTGTFAPFGLKTIIDSHLKRTAEELRSEFDFDPTDLRPYFDQLFSRSAIKVGTHGLSHLQAIKQARMDLLKTEAAGAPLSSGNFTERWSKPAESETDSKADLGLGTLLSLADSIKKKIVEAKSQTDPTLYIANEILQSSELNLHGAQVSFLNFLRCASADIKQNGSIKNLGNMPFSCILFERVALVCEPPVAWNVDDKGRASSIEDGAILFGDGFKYFLVNGREVSPELIRNQHPISRVEYENEPDPFFKHILMQKLGLERYLREGNVPVVNENEHGRLYREEKLEQEPLAVLEIIESGDSRFVEVSSECSTISEAQQWIQNHGTKPAPEHEADVVQEVMETWKSHILSTERVDKNEVTSAVNAMYNFAGFDNPRLVICQSPWQETLMPSAITKMPGRTLEDLIQLEPKLEKRWRALYEQIEKQFGIPLSKMTAEFAAKEIGDFIPLTRGLRHSLVRFESMVKSDLPYLLTENIYQDFLMQQQRLFGSFLRNVLNVYQFTTLADTRFGDNGGFDKMLASMSFRWMAREVYSQRMERAKIDSQHVSNFITTPFDEQVVAYELLDRLSNDWTPRDAASFKRWSRIVKAAPNYMFFEKTCFVCERPSELNLDDHFRLHNTNGPALAFPDGSEIFSYHGVGVPSNVITDKESITIDAIRNELNVEHRTVMMSLYGESRFLIDSNADLLDEDECGSLYRVQLAGGEPLVMVRVKDPTPSKQGTMGTYYLRVPPDMETAKQAVAWTFGFDSPRDYAPQVET